MNNRTSGADDIEALVDDLVALARGIPVDEPEFFIARTALLTTIRDREERARREGREEAARYVVSQIGTFQTNNGPVKMVDGALGMVAAGIRALSERGEG